MLCPQPFATATVPAFIATDLPFRTFLLKALMLLLGPGSRRPIDESKESLARPGPAYMPHANRTPEDIYNTLTAIIADCPCWSREWQHLWPPVWGTAIPHHTGISRRKCGCGSLLDL